MKSNQHLLPLTLAVTFALNGFGISHTDFGRIADVTSQSVTYAPSALVVDGVYTGEALLETNDYWEAGWRSIVDVKPQTDTNHYVVATGWANRDEHWLDRVYEIREIPAPSPRRIYKYDLSSACIEYGEITNLITFISSDVGVKWMWDAAEILLESDPYFIAGTNKVIQSGLATESKVKKILDRAYEIGLLSGAAK